MFDRMKYIVLDNSASGERIYIFADHEQHSDVAARLKFRNDIVVGAGFVTHCETGLSCWGHSQSLDVVSRSEDTLLVNRLLGLD